jgi:hypothetical protein
MLILPNLADIKRGLRACLKDWPVSVSLRQKEGKWEYSLNGLQEQGWESMVTWLTTSATQL